METKTINLIIPGAATDEDSHRQVFIQVGTTVGDLLSQEHLQGYQLSLGPGKPFLSQGDHLFDQLDPNSKVYATTIAQQG